MILFIFMVMRYKQLVCMQSRFSCIFEFGNVFTKKIVKSRENNSILKHITKYLFDVVLFVWNIHDC